MILYTDDQFKRCVAAWKNADSVNDAVDDIFDILGIDSDCANIAGPAWCEFTRKIVDAANSSDESSEAAPREAYGTNDPLVSGFDLTNPPPNVRRFAELCIAMTQTYDRKNKDYGNSFSRSVQRYGKIAALTRMSDKWNRLENLMLNEDAKVKDESITDTLIDLASYALMTAMELEKMVWKNLE